MKNMESSPRQGKVPSWSLLILFLGVCRTNEFFAAIATLSKKSLSNFKTGFFSFKRALCIPFLTKRKKNQKIIGSKYRVRKEQVDGHWSRRSRTCELANAWIRGSEMDFSSCISVRDLVVNLHRKIYYYYFSYISFIFKRALYEYLCLNANINNKPHSSVIFARFYNHFYRTIFMILWAAPMMAVFYRT